MNKILLIVGSVIIVACILSLLFSALNLYGYYNVLDGSPSLYKNMHRRMIIFLVLGIVLAIVGTVCFIVRYKI